jgi:hypothetical protein
MMALEINTSPMRGGGVMAALTDAGLVVIRLVEVAGLSV